MTVIYYSVTIHNKNSILDYYNPAESHCMQLHNKGFRPQQSVSNNPWPLIALILAACSGGGGGGCKVPSSISVASTTPRPDPSPASSPEVLTASYPTVRFLPNDTGEQTGTISENKSRFFIDEASSTDLIRQVVGTTVTIQNINVVSPQKAIITGGFTDALGRRSSVDFEFIVSGEDAHLIQIQKYGDTALLFHILSSPDYENPKDTDGNNIYRVKATVKYGEQSVSEFFNLHILDVAEETSLAISGNSNSSSGFASEDLNANIKIEVKINEGETLIFSLENAPNSIEGEDKDDVEIVARGENNFELRFKQPTDHSNPTDQDGNNIYEFQFDGGSLSENLAFEVEVVSLEMV